MVVHKDDDDYFAGLLCGALLIVVVATIVLIRDDPAHLLATFTPEHVQMLNMFDSRGQQLAHRILILLLGILGIGFWLLRPVEAPSLPSSVRRPFGFVARQGGYFIAALVAALTLIHSGSPPSLNYLDFQGRYPLGVVLRTQTLFALMVGGVFAVYISIRAHSALGGDSAVARGVAYVAVVVYAVTLVLLGVFKTPDFSGFSPALLAGVEWHYSGSVASADRLAIGQRLGDVAIHSGLLPSVLLAVWQKTVGMLDFGRHIQVVASLQAIMLVIAIAAYRVWYSARTLPWLLAVLLVLPWIQPLHAATLYPNQSAWRFLGLGVGVLVLILIHARDLRYVVPVLGATGSISFLWNGETGICLLLGYFFFLVLRTSHVPRRSLTKAALVFLLACLMPFAAFIVVVRLGLGYWPDIIATSRALPLISGFAQGYGGLPFRQIDPLAGFIFVHSLYVLTRGLLKWGFGSEMTPRECCRVAMAGLLVLWAAYYFKGPERWNLWSFLFLYGFFIGDHLTPSVREKLHGTIGSVLRSPKLVALSVVILPAIAASNLVTLHSAILAVRQPACPQLNVLSGVCIPAAIAVTVREKAIALRERSAREPTLFFTAHSYLLPLVSGISQPLRERDPFSDVILKTDFDRLSRQIFTIAPACVLFDDPASPLSGYDDHRRFYARLRTSIASFYESERTERGWEAWCLKKR